MLRYFRDLYRYIHESIPEVKVSDENTENSIREVIELQRQIGDRLADFESQLIKRSVPLFPDWDASDPPVRTALFDLVKPCDVVFDVGCHVGAITSSLSRLVGPRGIVVAIEPYFPFVRQLNANLCVNRLTNVTVVPALASSENARLTALQDSNSEVSEIGADLVETVTIDWLCDIYKLAPSLIRLGHNGTEHDAVRGALRVVDRFVPHFIFKYSSSSAEIFQILSDKQYMFFNIDSYVNIPKKIEFNSHFEKITTVAIHTSKIDNSGYKKIAAETIIRVENVQLDSDMKSISFSISLLSGRYILDVSGQIFENTDIIYSRVGFNGRVMVQNWEDSARFMQNHRQLPFNATHDGMYHFEIGEPFSDSGALQTFTFTISKVLRSGG